MVSLATIMAMATVCVSLSGVGGCCAHTLRLSAAPVAGPGQQAAVGPFGRPGPLQAVDGAAASTGAPAATPLATPPPQPAHRAVMTLLVEHRTQFGEFVDKIVQAKGGINVAGRPGRAHTPASPAPRCLLPPRLLSRLLPRLLPASPPTVQRGRPCAAAESSPERCAAATVPLLPPPHPDSSDLLQPRPHRPDDQLLQSVLPRRLPDPDEGKNAHRADSPNHPGALSLACTTWSPATVPQQGA